MRRDSLGRLHFMTSDFLIARFLQSECPKKFQLLHLHLKMEIRVEYLQLEPLIMSACDSQILTILVNTIH